MANLTSALHDSFDLPVSAAPVRHASARQPAAQPARPHAPRNYIPRRPSLLNRLFAMLVIMRQRQAEREVARFLANTGGKFTDSVEREILRRLA